MGRQETESLRIVLARNVRQLRHDRGLSQEELADRAGLHRTYVGSIERGERNLTVDNIEKIARGLDVDAAQLLAGASDLAASDGSARRSSPAVARAPGTDRPRPAGRRQR